MRFLKSGIVAFNLVLSGLFTVCLAVDTYQVDNNAILHFQNAQRYMTLDMLDAAIREYQIAIRLKPNTMMSASIYNDLGLAFLQAKLTDRAVVSFQQAISLNPNFALYYQNLSKAYGQSGKTTSAIKQVEASTRLNQEDVSAWYLKGVLYESQGKTEQARQAFQTYLTLAPNSNLADSVRSSLDSLKR